MDLGTAKSTDAEALVSALETEHLTQLVGLFSRAMNDEIAPLNGRHHIQRQRLPATAPPEQSPITD
jgi:hypothetical protein